MAADMLLCSEECVFREKRRTICGIFFYFEEEEFCAESNAPSFIPRVLFAFDVYLLEAPVEEVV